MPRVTVLRRGNSKHWYIQFQIGGRTVVRSSRTTSKRIAEQMETQLRAEVHAERYLGRKKEISLDTAIRQFVESKAGTPNHRNLLAHQRTLLSYFGGARPVSSLTADEVERFNRDRTTAGIAAQTRKHNLNALRSSLTYAKRRGFNVPDLLLPAVSIARSKVRYLSAAEETALLSQLDPYREAKGLAPVDQRSSKLTGMMQDTFDLVVLLLDTGARYGEIAGLAWNQIDLETRTIRLWRPKVRNEGVLHMTDRVFAVLTRRIATAGGFVFTNKSGGPRGYTFMTLRKALDRAGLRDCTIHTLRHTHASRLIQNGLSVYEVQAVLGHSDPKTTMRYAHLEVAKVTSKARDVINRFNAAAQRVTRCLRPDNLNQD